MIYTTGVWTVKEGQEEEFVRSWQRMADQVSLEHGIVARLLRDVEHPDRLVSIAGPWKSAEQVAALLSSASFQAATAAMEPLLESLEVSRYELVAEVS